jgi:hypothetical protein
MKAPELYDRIQLIAKLADHRALSLRYRVAAVTHDSIRACAPYGVLECMIELGIKDEIFISAEALVNQLRHCADQEFTIEIKNNALYYYCGSATGRLALLDTVTVPIPQFDGDMAPLNEQFGERLERAAIACEAPASTLRSVGLDGIQITNRNGSAYGYASDNTVLSACRLGSALPINGTITLKPEAVELLVAVTQRLAKAAPALAGRHDPGSNRAAEQEALLGAELQAQVATGKLSFAEAARQVTPAGTVQEALFGSDASTVFCLLPPTMALQLNQFPPLQYDIGERLQKFLGETTTMPLQRETVSEFLKRADGFPDKQHALIEVNLDRGAVRLAFTDTPGATTEHYRLSDAPDISTRPVRIEARRLARALTYTSHLVFDYAEQNILVLRGPGEFVFVISGRQ